MTNDECQLFMDAGLACFTRVGQNKVKVEIKKKVSGTGPGPRYQQKTEWAVRRVDNGRDLQLRNCRALHKTKDFTD